MLDRVVQGEVPRKHHIAFRDAEGTLLFEEAFTQSGFEGPYTLAYHRGRPHAQHAAQVAHGWDVPRGAASSSCPRPAPTTTCCRST